MKTLFSRLFILLLFITILSSCVKEKAKVLIIGDSISIGYTPFVETDLSEYAEVFHNAGNAKFTDNGLDSIDSWLAVGEWDVIQFNWGLWDLCYRHPDSKVQGKRDKVNGTVTNTVEQYASNLDALVTILESKTDAKLIFVTTSYVPVDEAGRYSEDAIKYNAAAKEVMKKHSVIVNDIFEKTIPIHHELGKGSDDVHYTEEGYEAISKYITDFLKKEI